MGQLLQFPRTPHQPSAPPVLAVPGPETGGPRQRTLADLLTQYQADFMSDRAPSTRYGRACFFRQVLHDLGPLPLDTITPEVIRGWKTALSAKHTPGTVHRYMTHLGAAFRVATDEYGWISTDPFRRVRKPAPSPGVIRCLTPEEMPRLLATCRRSLNPVLYDIVVVALATAGRKNEVRALRWEQVDLALQRVTFHVTKKQRWHTVPLVGEAYTVLEERYERRQKTVSWVFPRDDGQAPRAIETAWQTALRRADVPQFRFHDLRHSSASFLAMSGASLLDIATILGHKDMGMVQRYAHLTHGHLQSVVERMHAHFLTTTPGQGGSTDV